MSSDDYGRSVQVYDMPLEGNIKLLNPQNISIKFNNSVSIDIGRLCYLERGLGIKENPWGKKQVLLSSFCDDRIPTVHRLIEFASDMAAHSGLKGPTLHSSFSRLMGFVDWADSISVGNVLASKQRANDIFRSYVDYWRDRYSRNEVSQNAAAKQMSEVASILGRYFEDDTFARGLNFIRRDNKTKEPTLPPATLEQGRTLALCEAVFSGICDLILNDKDYPYPLKVPEYLRFPKNTLWLFPSRDWFRTPSDIEKIGCLSGGFDYSNGAVLSLEQLAKVYPKHRAVQRTLVNALGLLSVGNKSGSDVRLRMAASAFNAYVIVFFAETGMTGAELRGLQWADDYDVTPSRQGFRTVKWRAYGREGVFELSLSGTVIFQRFLKLREFLLQGQKFEYLFFRKRYSKKQPAPYASSLIGTYQFLNRIDPEAKIITVRRWRAAKSDWLVRNADPSVAAMILQNSEKTVLQHYAEGSEAAFRDEMSLVLNKLSLVVTSSNSEKLTERPLGSCTAYGEPSVLVVDKGVEPNCRNPEGCLFCEKFKVHPDEEDARKLLSCRYVINMMSPSNGSYEDFESLLRPTLNRIDMILAEISERDAGLVLRVSREVEELGELSSYWSSKAQMLLAMGF